jgi:hypothetical protein
VCMHAFRATLKDIRTTLASFSKFAVNNDCVSRSGLLASFKYSNIRTRASDLYIDTEQSNKVCCFLVRALINRSFVTTCAECMCMLAREPHRSISDSIRASLSPLKPTLQLRTRASATSSASRLGLLATDECMRTCVQAVQQGKDRHQSHSSHILAASREAEHVAQELIFSCRSPCRADRGQPQVQPQQLEAHGIACA